MFKGSTYFKALFGFMAIFITYNVMQALYHNSKLNAIDSSQEKTEIIANLGNPAEIFNCKTSATLPAFFNKEDLCQGKAAEVYTFPRCKFILLCQGWNYVVFDDKGRVAYKYALIMPMFPGGPAL